MAIMAIDLTEDILDHNDTSSDQLIVANTEDATAGQNSDEEDDEIVALLENTLTQCRFNVGKKQMILYLIEYRKKANCIDRQQMIEVADIFYRQRQKSLRDIGVSEDLLYLLPINHDSPIPSELQSEIDQRRAQQKRRDDEKEEARVKGIFESTWLHEQERKMVDLQVEIEQCTGDTKIAKTYLLTTCADALKIFYEKHKVSKESGLELRRNMCVEMGLLKESEAHLVSSLYEALPLCQEQETNGELLESDDGSDLLFYTPKTPSYSPVREEYMYNILESPGFGTQRRKRKSKEIDSQQNSQQKKLTSFFTSKDLV